MKCIRFYLTPTFGQNSRLRASFHIFCVLLPLPFLLLLLLLCVHGLQYSCVCASAWLLEPGHRHGRLIWTIRTVFGSGKRVRMAFPSVDVEVDELF